MNKEKVFTPKFISGVGILTAVEIVLYIVGSLIQNGTGVSINLALIPIAIGAILFGPICGVVLGVVNGVAVLLTPGTQLVFMNVDMFGEWCIFGTIVVCLLKCSVAGLVSAYVYKLIKKGLPAVIAASFAVPVINTGLFVVGACIFFQPMLSGLLASVFSFNFIIEVVTVAALSPAIIRVVEVVNKRNVASTTTSENNEEK